MNQHYFTKVLLYVIVSFITICVFAQDKKLKKGNSKYDNMAYIDAIKIYERLAEDGYQSPELFKRLGNAHYFNAQYKEAYKWYSELFALNEEQEAVYYLRYSQAMRAVGQEKDAKEMYRQYMKILELNLANNKSYLVEIENEPDRYDLKPLPFNSPGIDFGITKTNNKLLFASTRDRAPSLTKHLDVWNNLNFLDLYEVSENLDGTYGKVRQLKGQINTDYHESTPIITRDGKTMYFTGTNKKGWNKSKKAQTLNLKIYRARLGENGKWGSIEDLSINSNSYSNAHPALSPSEDKLYFASDRPGSTGATDIFVVDINPDGTLETPHPVEGGVNTTGRESFPFVTDRNELYFSSDGHFGLGGYDVFYMLLNENMDNGVVNVGKPINSEGDDFAFSIDVNTHKGYLSSNRPGNLGKDDVYAFTEIKDIIETFKGVIYGSVIDKKTNKPIEGARVSLRNVNPGNELYYTFSDKYGKYTVEIANRYQDRHIEVTKEEYKSLEQYPEKGIALQKLDFYLESLESSFFEGFDLSKVLEPNTIYFDYNESQLREDSKIELQKVANFLTEHSNLKLEIRSHTDSRGNANYNLKLSQRRAVATLSYLVGLGVSKDRIQAKGYGETQLLNRCKEGIRCSGEEHQENRRSEFIVKHQAD
ncbi:OmpA family protein [Aestuariivivens insulae]|uniref:OmpA family protein n=1 Tax=Aestuariivivens insulae TaxID=1621988 RepID=UPI001F594BC8|nr:OmpA family protein [Aestuariivivens insulae]